MIHPAKTIARQSETSQPDPGRPSADPCLAAPLERVLADPAATARAGASLGAALGPGDTVLLSGPLGAGKSALARALILARLAAEGRHEDVPSPSYTLINVYETLAGPIWHADLYRLGTDAEDIAELGLADAFGEALVLVEWPDRLGALTPPRHLALDLAPTPEEARRLIVRASGAGWGGALEALFR